MVIKYSLSEIESVAKQVIAAISGSPHVAFYGEMGVGKTTLIKEICRRLGVTEEVNSPTFAIVNEYEGDKGLIYHFDFYRINTLQEALDFGIYDYFDSGNLTLMEWPECVAQLLPDDTVSVRIELLPDNRRQLTIE